MECIVEKRWMINDFSDASAFQCVQASESTVCSVVLCIYSEKGYIERKLDSLIRQYRMSGCIFSAIKECQVVIVGNVIDGHKHVSYVIHLCSKLLNISHW